MAQRPSPKSGISDLEPVSISRLGCWSECQTKGYLRYVEKEQPATEAHYFLTGGLLHELFEGYYKYELDSISAVVHGKLLAELEKRGVPRPKIIQALAASKDDIDLLERFRTGEIKKPDGSSYTSPRMTKIYKDEAARLGITRAWQELSNVPVPGLELPSGGLIELVGRIVDLANRYEANLLIDRDKFEEIHVEGEFDFVFQGVRFRGFMDLVAKVKPEFHHEFGGRSWVLIDYKTGKAHDLTDHSASAHSSLQLSLYHHVVTNVLNYCTADELYTALHYVDATFAAVTTRMPGDFERLVGYAKLYQTQEKSPGLVKRMFYDGDQCSRCELRDACIKRFGLPTSACAGPAVEEVPTDLDWSF